MDRLAEVAVTLAAHIVTAAAGTFDLVTSVTSQQLADLYPTHFLEVPTDLGVSQDFYTGMDTTAVPDLNVGDYQMDNLFSERHYGADSFRLTRKTRSPDRQTLHLPIPMLLGNQYQGKCVVLRPLVAPPVSLQ